MAKSNGQAVDDDDRQSDEGKRKSRPYPAAPFSECLEIGEAILKFGGGERIRRLTLLEKMGRSETSGSVRKMITDSGKYKVTKGSFAAEYLELTPEGRIVCDDASTERARRKAAFDLAIAGVAPFNLLYSEFVNKRLPDDDVIAERLEESPVEVPDTSECVRYFLDNAESLKLIRKVGEARTLFSVEAVLEEIQPSGGARDRAITESVRSHRISPRSQPTVIVGEPVEAGGKPICFVIMPFTERSPEHRKGFFSEVLSSLIIPAATDAGFVVKTAHRKGSDVIQSTIVRELLKADLVLVDLTEHNPNVLFELGMRMREDKPVVLIRAEGTGSIFDVDNMLRVEEYNARLWKSTVEDDLPKLTEHIRGAWENRENEDTYMRLLGREFVPLSLRSPSDT